MLRRVWVQNRKRKGKNGRRSKKAWRGKDRQAVCHVAGGGAGTRRCIVPHTGLVLSTCSMLLQTIRSKVWSTVWITEYQFTDYAVILYNNLSILYSVCGVLPLMLYILSVQGNQYRITYIPPSRIQLRGLLLSWPQPLIGPWGRPPPQHLTGMGNAGMNHRHHGVIRSQTGTATACHCPD